MNERPDEWQRWQSAWHTAPAAEHLDPDALLAQLERRLARHRRGARIFTALDAAAALLLCALGFSALTGHPDAWTVAWAVSIFGFSLALLGFSIWNRRDVLFFSAQPEAGFLSALRLRASRRERWPGVLAGVLAAEIAVGLALFAVVSPQRVALAIACYVAFLLLLAPGWLWWRRRLRRERANLEALCEAAERH